VIYLHAPRFKERLLCPFSNLNSMPFANTPGRSAFFPQSNLFNNDFGFSMPGGPANIPMHPFGKLIYI
jgi:hypothetical protein